MIKILRYLLAILFIAFIIFTLKNKTTRLKVLKIIFSVFMALIIIIMPFENLILKFDSPEQAFKYAVSNSTVIKIIENENTALVIYDDAGDVKATIINNSQGKWKASFLPNNQSLSRLKDSGIILITRERQINNFYVMIAVRSEVKSVSDNMNSSFETFSLNDKWTNFVTYVESCNNNYIIKIDGDEYKIM